MAVIRPQKTELKKGGTPLNITCDGQRVAQITAHVRRNPDSPRAVITLGNRTIFPNESEVSTYNRLRDAAKVDLTSYPARMDGVRQYVDPEDYLTPMYTGVSVAIDPDAPQQLIDRLLNENSQTHLLTLLPAVRRSVLLEIARISDEQTDVNLALDPDIERKMMGQGIFCHPHIHPMRDEWKSRRQRRAARTVRARHPVFLLKSNMVDNSNMSVARALLKSTELTAVNPARIWTQKESWLPTLSLTDVRCHQRGEIRPISTFAADSAVDSITMVVTLHEQGSDKILKVEADYFLDNSHPDCALSAKPGSLLVATKGRDAQRTIDLVMADMRALCMDDDRYLPSLTAMLISEQEASEMTLARFARRLTNPYLHAAGTLVPGTETRAGDFVLRYEPQEKSD